MAQHICKILYKSIIDTGQQIDYMLMPILHTELIFFLIYDSDMLRIVPRWSRKSAQDTHMQDGYQGKHQLQKLQTPQYFGYYPETYVP